MNVTEALDREEIVERAESVRFWLLGFLLSNRASGAIQRELGAIIADDPGTTRRPLAGLSVADFVGELHSPNGGAVGRVKSVGDAVLNELRKAIPADTRVAAPAKAADEAPWAEYELPETQPAPRRGRPKGSGKAAQKFLQEAPAPAQALTEAPATAMAAPQVDEPQAAEPQAAELEAVAPKRPRGRPRRAVAPEPVAAEEAAPQRRPGRPRRDVAPMASVPATNGPQPATNKAAPREADPTFDQLIRLWPSLHPHARRAVVLYASDMLIEAR